MEEIKMQRDGLLEQGAAFFFLIGFSAQISQRILFMKQRNIEFGEIFRLVSFLGIMHDPLPEHFNMFEPDGFLPLVQQTKKNIHVGKMDFPGPEWIFQPMENLSLQA